MKRRPTEDSEPRGPLGRRSGGWDQGNHAWSRGKNSAYEDEDKPGPNIGGIITALLALSAFVWAVFSR